MLRMQHYKTHERAAERPLILALFKHYAFQKQQHDAWQSAAVRISNVLRTSAEETTDTRMLRAADATCVHLGLDAVCALKAATTPAYQ